MSLTTLNLYDNILRLTNEVGDTHDVDLTKYIDVLPADSVVAAALQNDGKTLVLTQPNTDAIVVDLESILDANGTGTIVNSVAGKTGTVSLVKADVGLSNVDNTADLDKPTSNPTKEYICCAIKTANGGDITAWHRAVSADIGARSRGFITDMNEGFDPIALTIPKPEGSEGAGLRPTHLCSAFGIGVKKDLISGRSTMRITGNLEVLGSITGANGSSINYALCNACLCTNGNGTMYQITDTLGVKCSIATSMSVTADGKITSELVSTSNPTRSSTSICDITKKVSASTLCDISDYVAASVVDGTVLTWNATYKCWEPRPVESTQPAAAAWGAITGNIVNQSDLNTCFNTISTVLSQKACFDSDFYNSGEAESDSYLMVGSKTDAYSPIIRSSGIKACGSCYVYKCDIHAKAFVGTDLCISGNIVVNGVTLDPDGFTETTTTMNYVPATKTLSYINEAGATYSANLSGLTGATIDQISYTTETGVLKFDMSDASIKTVVIDSGVGIQAGIGAVCYDGTKLVNYIPIVTTELPFSCITGNYTDNASIKNAIERKIEVYDGNTLTSGYIPIVRSGNAIANSDLMYDGTKYSTSSAIMSKNSNDHAIKTFEYNTKLSTITLCSNVCCTSISIPKAPVKLCEVGDVSASIAADGDVLVWNASSSKWNATKVNSDVKSTVCYFTDSVGETIIHNLGRYPEVTITDTEGNTIMTQVVQKTLNCFIVYFSNTTSGRIQYI